MSRILSFAFTFVLAAHVGARGAEQSPPGSDAPLRLRDAMVKALRNSPRLRPAADQVESAAIQRRLVSSRFLPKIVPQLVGGADPALPGQRTLGVGVTERLSTGTELQASANSWRYGTGGSEVRDAGYTFAVTQPLLRGFGPAATYDLKNAERVLAGSERSFADAEQQLMVTVAESYFNVLRQERLTQAGQRALDRAVKLRTASEARAKVGLATQLDVLRAELMASQAEASLALSREGHATAVDELNVLLGRPPAAPLALAHEDLTDEGLSGSGLAPDAADLPDQAIAPSDAAAADALVARALGSRLDLLEAHDRMKDAARAADLARWNLFPDVSVSAGYTRRGLGSASSLVFDQLLSGWRYGVSTSYSLDRSEQNAAQATAQIGVRAAERAALELQRRASADVRRAHRAWLRAAQTIEIQQKALDLADRQLRLAELRYERGLAGNFDVIDAENSRFQAESALIGAQIDRAVAGLTLKRVSGTLDPKRLTLGASK